jgi:hypothetical protein
LHQRRQKDAAKNVASFSESLFEEENVSKENRRKRFEEHRLPVVRIFVDLQHPVFKVFCDD